MRFLKTAFATAALAAVASNASAAVITLDFEGAGNQAQLLEFYNGGTDSQGNSGVDYDISFGENALSIIDADDGGSGNIGNEPSPSTVLFFLSGSAILNYEAGFDTGFSFFYTSVSFSGTVSVYDGLDGTGNLLGTIDLPALGAGPGDPNGSFSNWAAAGLEFDGIAKSIDFGGTVNQIAYDNVTFGSATPTPAIPEPSTYALMALGLAGMGFVARRNKRV